MHSWQSGMQQVRWQMQQEGQLWNPTQEPHQVVQHAVVAVHLRLDAVRQLRAAARGQAVVTDKRLQA